MPFPYPHMPLAHAPTCFWGTRLKIACRFQALALMIILCCIRAPALAQNPGILLMDDKGNILYSKNKDIPKVPASTLKLLTGLAAIKHFGGEFRFSTLASYDPVSRDLHVKGLGDPLFISEAIEDFTGALLKQFDSPSFGPVRHILLDHSFFDKNIHIPGTGNSLNPYDATTGALCANFNTLAFRWNPETGRFVSDEPQTPLLEIFMEKIRSTGMRKGRILLEMDYRQIYAGLLIQSFLQARGTPVSGKIKPGTLPEVPGHPHFYYPSPFTLNQIIEKLLKFSNNFIANQLILTMGARIFGPPANLEKGIRALEGFSKNDLGLEGIALAEGSGLSRQNRLTPLHMGQILLAFMPFHKLMPENRNEYYKTGTLSDVRCRAGFIKGKNKKLYPFVIMINEQNKGYDAILKDLIQMVGIRG